MTWEPGLYMRKSTKNSHKNTSLWNDILDFSSNFYHFLSGHTTPMRFSSHTNSIEVLGRLDSIHSPHKSPTGQCCPSHRLQKWSKETEISLIFTTFWGYTTPNCLPSRTNELKVLRRLVSTHFYERHVFGATYHRIRQLLQMVFSHPPLGPPWNWFPGRTNGIREGRRVHLIQVHLRDRSRVAIVLSTVG